MELIKEYGSYLLTILSILITIISFIFKAKSSKTNKKIFGVLSFLPQFINEAEKVFRNVNKSGSEKIVYVLNKLSFLCSECGLCYDEDFWLKKIEEYLSTPQKK